MQEQAKNPVSDFEKIKKAISTPSTTQDDTHPFKKWLNDTHALLRDFHSSATVEDYLDLAKAAKEKISEQSKQDRKNSLSQAQPKINEKNEQDQKSLNPMLPPLYKIVLAGYVLAASKTDNHTEKGEIFEEIKKWHEKVNKQINKITIETQINPRRQPYSDELSRIENEITAKAYVARDSTTFFNFAELYYNLAIQMGIKSVTYIDKSGIEKTEPNIGFLLKATRYLSFARDSASNPIDWMKYELDMWSIICRCQEKFFVFHNNKNSANEFKTAKNKIEKLKERLKQLAPLGGTDQQLKLEKIQTELHDATFKIQEYGNVKTIQAKADERRQNILNAVFNSNDTAADIPSIEKRIDRKDASASEADYYKLQVFKEDNYRTQMQAVKNDKYKVQLPEEFPQNHSVAVATIEKDVALSQFYETFKTLMTECYIGALAADSGKVVVDQGVIGKFIGMITDTTAITKVIGPILGLINSKKINNENKNIAALAPSIKEAEKIITQAALQLTLTYKDQINSLSTEPHIPQKNAKFVAIPPGTVVLAAFAAKYAISALANGLPPGETTEASKLNFIVEAVKQHKEPKILKSAFGSIQSGTSKFDIVVAFLGDKVGFVRGRNGKNMNHHEVLGEGIPTVKVEKQQSKLTLAESLKNLWKGFKELVNRVDAQDERMNQMQREIAALKLQNEYYRRMIDQNFSGTTASNPPYPTAHNTTGQGSSTVGTPSIWPQVEPVRFNPVSYPYLSPNPNQNGSYPATWEADVSSGQQPGDNPQSGGGNHRFFSNQVNSQEVTSAAGKSDQKTQQQVHPSAPIYGNGSTW